MKEGEGGRQYIYVYNDSDSKHQEEADETIRWKVNTRQPVLEGSDRGNQTLGLDTAGQGWTGAAFRSLSRGFGEFGTCPKPWRVLRCVGVMIGGALVIFFWRVCSRRSFSWRSVHEVFFWGEGFACVAREAKETDVPWYFIQSPVARLRQECSASCEREGRGLDRLSKVLEPLLARSTCPPVWSKGRMCSCEHLCFLLRLVSLCRSFYVLREARG